MALRKELIAVVLLRLVRRKYYSRSVSVGLNWLQAVMAQIVVLSAKNTVLH